MNIAELTIECLEIAGVCRIYGLTTPNGENRTLRPCRRRLEPKRRRKTSLERLFSGSW